MQWVKAGTLKNGESFFWREENGFDDWAVEKRHWWITNPTTEEMAEIKTIFPNSFKEDA